VENGNTRVTNNQIGNDEKNEKEQSRENIKVRERLGNLYGWSSKASRPALTLCKSIEAFMDTFFQNNNPATGVAVGEAFEWPFKINAVGTRDNANITLVVKKTRGKWLASIGMVEAALSLWLANLEDSMKAQEIQMGERMAKQSGEIEEPRNRRRVGEAVEVRKHIFYRILGDEHILSYPRR
jgi:hypothetical protein